MALETFHVRACSGWTMRALLRALYLAKRGTTVGKEWPKARST